MAELLANNAIGNLNASILSGALSLILQSGQGALFPPSGNFRVIIDSEIILVGARSGDTLSSLTRGDGGTSAAGHSAGAQVTQLITKESFPELVKSTTNFPIAGLAGYPSDVTKQLRGDGSWLVGGSLIGIQVITATGTYTPTSGTSRVVVVCIGGGGSGGSCAGVAASSFAGGAGGSGAYSEKLITSGFSGVTATIGAGGAAPAAGNVNGNAGGDTSFGALALAKGGAGGAAAVANANTAGAAGGLASSGTGDLKIDGQDGAQALTVNANLVFMGAGGSAPRGGSGGGNGLAGAAVNGKAGKNYGGGGSGAGAGNVNGNAAGGAGAQGVVIVYEYA